MCFFPAFAHCVVIGGAYLHNGVGLTVADCRARDNDALCAACARGRMAVVEYLHRQVGLTADDFRARGNDAMRWASFYGRVALVEYLTPRVGSDCRQLA